MKCNLLQTMKKTFASDVGSIFVKVRYWAVLLFKKSWVFTQVYFLSFDCQAFIYFPQCVSYFHTVLWPDKPTQVTVIHLTIVCYVHVFRGRPHPYQDCDDIQDWRTDGLHQEAQYMHRLQDTAGQGRSVSKINQSVFYFMSVHIKVILDKNKQNKNNNI